MYCFPWNFHKSIWNVYFLHPRPISPLIFHISQSQGVVYTSTPIYLIVIPPLTFNPLLITKSGVHHMYPPISTSYICLIFSSLLHAKCFSLLLSLLYWNICPSIWIVKLFYIHHAADLSYLQIFYLWLWSQ